MGKTPVFIYLWLLYHIIFILAFILRRLRPQQIVCNTGEGTIFKPLYFYTKRIFLSLFVLLTSYLVCIKWLLGWRIDSWYLEATSVFFMFACGHFVFIVCKSPGYEDKFTRYRRPYAIFSAVYIASFYGRLMLAILGVFSYNVHNIAFFLPDIRRNDLYLFNNYYLSYSEAKDIVIEKKFFIFSKDMVKHRALSNAICSFNVSQFSDTPNDNPPDNPFAYPRRSHDNLVLFTNNTSGQGKGYVDFRLDSLGRLQVKGYRYTFPNDDFKKGLQYVPCGAYIVK